MSKIKNSNKNSSTSIVEETKLPVDQIEETGDNNVLINDEESNMNKNEIIEENVDKSDEIIDENVDEKTEEETVDFETKVRELAEELGWEHIFNKMTTVSSFSSKMEHCVDIYEKMIVDSTKRRIDIINQFMIDVNISKDCASTYFQTIRTKKKKDQQVD